MAEGDYPFLVYVWNRFSKLPEGSSPIILSVKFHHWSNGERPNYPTNGIDNLNEYSIPPGDMIGFPLYWNDEQLEITLDPTGLEMPEVYYISLGSQGIWSSTNNLVVGETIKWIPSGLGEYIAKRNQVDNKAGIWEIKDQGLIWTLTFRKLKPDPETTNVTVGPVIL